jgi:hypothetical protein
VRGLREGADDCVIKPVHYGAGGACRRGAASPQRPRAGPRRVGDLVIDPATRSVRVGERPIELANKEFALQRAIASDPTRVFTKEELLRDFWDFCSLGRTRTLDSHASRLRRKLDPDHCRYVVNVWGGAYRHCLSRFACLDPALRGYRGPIRAHGSPDRALLLVARGRSPSRVSRGSISVRARRRRRMFRHRELRRAA